MLKHGCTADPTMPGTVDESTGPVITASSALVVSDDAAFFAAARYRFTAPRVLPEADDPDPGDTDPEKPAVQP